MPLTLADGGGDLIFTYDTQMERTGITTLLDDLNRAGISFRDLRTEQSSLEDIFVGLVSDRPMNYRAVLAIYRFEMARTGRTIWQSIVSPVLSTSLYFVVFGAAIGSRITEIEGVSYGAFIVPGLIMLTLLTQSTMNASFGIYFPRFTGTIYEILSAPISAFEIALGYVGAAATKSIILGLIILATSWLFVPLHIAHPFWMIVFLRADRGHLQPARLHHRHLGRRLRAAADRAAADHHAADVPRRHVLLDHVLPPVWQTITLFNPVVYLVSGFRWSFFEIADVRPGISIAMTLLFLGLCLAHGLVDLQDRLQAQEIAVSHFRGRE